MAIIRRVAALQHYILNFGRARARLALRYQICGLPYILDYSSVVDCAMPQWHFSLVFNNEMSARVFLTSILITDCTFGVRYRRDVWNVRVYTDMYREMENEGERERCVGVQGKWGYDGFALIDRWAARTLSYTVDAQWLIYDFREFRRACRQRCSPYGFTRYPSHVQWLPPKSYINTFCFGAAGARGWWLDTLFSRQVCRACDFLYYMQPCKIIVK